MSQPDDTNSTQQQIEADDPPIQPRDPSAQTQDPSVQPRDPVAQPTSSHHAPQHQLSLLLRSLGACTNALTWSRSYNDYRTAWEKCHRGDWLIWGATRMSVDMRAIILLCAACVRPAMACLEDRRSRLAIDVAERIVRGDATIPEARAALQGAGAVIDEKLDNYGCFEGPAYVMYAAHSAYNLLRLVLEHYDTRHSWAYQRAALAGEVLDDASRAMARHNDGDELISMAAYECALEKIRRQQADAVRAALLWEDVLPRLQQRIG